MLSLFGLLGATYAVYTALFCRKLKLSSVNLSMILCAAFYPLNSMRARYENEEEEEKGVGLDLLIQGLIVGF